MRFAILVRASARREARLFFERRDGHFIFFQVLEFKHSVGVKGFRSGLKSECADIFHQSFLWLLRHTDDPQKYLKCDPFFQPQKKVCLQIEILVNLFKYILFCFILLLTSSSPWRKDQFAVLYWSPKRAKQLFMATIPLCFESFRCRVDVLQN